MVVLVDMGHQDRELSSLFESARPMYVLKYFLGRTRIG